MAATKRMQAKRKEKLSLITSEATPDTLAIADVWFSNHKKVKDESRKSKMEAMEKLMETKLDSYHSKLMENLQKPVADFFKFFNDNNNEDEEERPSTKKTKTDDIIVPTFVPALAETVASTPVTKVDSNGRRQFQPEDWARFF